MNRVRVLAMAGIAAGAIATLAACGGTTAGQSTAAANHAAATGSSSATAGNTAGLAKLAAVQSPVLGPIVTDAKGMTLYLFTKDTRHPPKSNCDGECATEWPPALVPASGNVQLSGVATNEVGTVTRSDGTKQLTINNWPVYEYAGDKQPGDVNGQGVGHVWYAVTPEGKKATAPAQQSGATGSTSDSSGNASDYTSGY